MDISEVGSGYVFMSNSAQARIPHPVQGVNLPGKLLNVLGSLVVSRWQNVVGR